MLSAANIGDFCTVSGVIQEIGTIGGGNPSYPFIILDVEEREQVAKISIIDSTAVLRIRAESVELLRDAWKKQLRAIENDCPYDACGEYGKKVEELIEKLLATKYTDARLAEKEK